MRNCLILFALCVLPAVARAAVLVDNFENSQNLAIAPGTSQDTGGVDAGGNAIGGARWASLSTNGGANPTGSSTATFDGGGNGILAFTPHEDDAVRLVLIYDGDFAGPHTMIDATGLGGINLTASGDLTLRLLARSTTEVDGFLFLYSFNSSSWYQFNFAFPGLGLDVPFSQIDIDILTPDFSTGSGFSASSLGAISLVIDTSATTGLVQIKRMAFTPEPASAVLAAIGMAGLLYWRRRFRRMR